MVKNRLKEIRMKEYMMNIVEFSKLLEISNTTYCNWESNISRPNLEKALMISQKLNKNIEEIWYLDKV